MAKTKPTEKSAPQKTYYQAVGRRREASAMVRLYPLSAKQTVTVHGKALKQGDFVVNKTEVETYFPGEVNKLAYRAPLKSTGTLNEYAVSVYTSGGGKRGQLGATIHGIARTLELIDKDTHRPILKKLGFLTRDPRVKERRKAGLAQKARAQKSSPKR